MPLPFLFAFSLKKYLEGNSTESLQMLLHIFLLRKHLESRHLRSYCSSFRRNPLKIIDPTAVSRAFRIKNRGFYRNNFYENKTKCLVWGTLDTIVKVWNIGSFMSKIPFCRPVKNNYFANNNNPETSRKHRNLTTPGLPENTCRQILPRSWIPDKFLRLHKGFQHTFHIQLFQENSL